jgi:REP element-mobilizing transposase RayT
MAKNQRCVLPGEAYHITQRGTHRQRVFFKDADRSAYLRLTAHHLADAGVRVPAWNPGGFPVFPVPSLGLF